MVIIHAASKEEADLVRSSLGNRWQTSVVTDWAMLDSRAMLARCIVATVLRSAPDAVRTAGTVQEAWPLIPFVAVVTTETNNLRALATVRVAGVVFDEELHRLPAAVSVVCETSLLERFAQAMELVGRAREPLLSCLIEYCRGSRLPGSISKEMTRKTGRRRTTLWSDYRVAFGADAPPLRVLLRLLGIIRAVEIRSRVGSWQEVASTLGCDAAKIRGHLRFFLGPKRSSCTSDEMLLHLRLELAEFVSRLKPHGEPRSNAHVTEEAHS